MNIQSKWTIAMPCWVKLHRTFTSSQVNISSNRGVQMYCYMKDQSSAEPHTVAAEHFSKNPSIAYRKVALLWLDNLDAEKRRREQREELWASRSVGQTLLTLLPGQKSCFFFLLPADWSILQTVLDTQVPPAGIKRQSPFRWDRENRWACPQPGPKCEDSIQQPAAA